MAAKHEMIESKSCLSRAFTTSKPYLAMISLQFGYAGMNIISKASLNRGMSHYVLVVYRHAIATAAIAPFALLLERKERPKITFRIFCQIFALALLGPVIDQNFYYAGLKYTSPTFSCALSNVLPAMTFIMAAIFRMERVKIKQIRSQAKIAGTLVCVGGAMLMTFYKGPTVHMFWSPDHRSKDGRTPANSSSTGSDDKEWIKGSLLLVGACLAWAAFFVLQAAVLKKYRTHLSLTALICFIGTLQSIVVTLALEHKASAWSLGWDVNLLSAVYSGVVTSGIAYYVQGLCMNIKGPVFATAFSPLMMVIVAIMASIILSETIYLGSLIGGILIVGGLYAVLWGKLKDGNMSPHRNCPDVLPKIELADAKNDIEAPTKIIHSAKENDEIDQIYPANSVSVNLTEPVKLSEDSSVDIPCLGDIKAKPKGWNN